MQNSNKHISRSVLTGYSYQLQKMPFLRKRSTEHAMLGAITAHYNPQELSCQYKNKKENKT